MKKLILILLLGGLMMTGTFANPSTGSGNVAFAREKYDLHMTIKRFVSDDKILEQDKKFIRR